jgi:hypothetical protein
MRDMRAGNVGKRSAKRRVSASKTARVRCLRIYLLDEIRKMTATETTPFLSEEGFAALL